MEQLVERLLEEYEQGKITRRHLIGAMTAAATLSAASVSTAFAAPGFHGIALNHVTFRVSDVQRSSRFYRDLAGLQIREQKERGQILAMDKSFLVLAQTATPPLGVEHFCISIANFDQKEVIARLKQEGLDPQVNVRGEIYVRDPDGLRVQVSAEDYAGQLP